MVVATARESAAAGEHPAHGFFVERYRTLRRRLSRALAGRHPADERPAPSSDPDPERAARVLIAATDGLQVQWLLDPASTDIPDDIARLRDVLLDALDRAAAPDRD